MKSLGMKLTLNNAATERLDAIFSARTVEAKDAYWIDGADSGEDYCYDCAKKEVEKLRQKDPENSEEYCIAGGYRTEHDGTPFCTTCSCRLDGNLTDYGASSEVDHFLECGFDPDSADDCFSMNEVVSTIGWTLHDWRYVRDYERVRDRQRYAALYRLARRILRADKPNSTLHLYACSAS